MVGLRTGSEGQREEHRMDSKGGSQVQKDAEPGVGPRDLGFRVPTWGVRALPGGKAKEKLFHGQGQSLIQKLSLGEGWELMNKFNSI